MCPLNGNGLFNTRIVFQSSHWQFRILADFPVPLFPIIKTGIAIISPFFYMSARLCALASPCNGFLFYCNSSHLFSITTPVLSLLLSGNSSPHLALLTHLKSLLYFLSAHQCCALLSHYFAQHFSAAPCQSATIHLFAPTTLFFATLFFALARHRISPTKLCQSAQHSYAAEQHSAFTQLITTVLSLLPILRISRPVSAMPLPYQSGPCLSFLPHPRQRSPRGNYTLKNCAILLCRCICHSPTTLR